MLCNGQKRASGREGGREGVVEDGREVDGSVGERKRCFVE